MDIKKTIKRQQEAIVKAMLEPFHGKKVLGGQFKLLLTTMRGAPTLQACAYMDKKNIVIHIGREADKAEEKILKYLEKKPEIKKLFALKPSKNKG